MILEARLELACRRAREGRTRPLRRMMTRIGGWRPMYAQHYAESLALLERARATGDHELVEDLLRTLERIVGAAVRDVFRRLFRDGPRVFFADHYCQQRRLIKRGLLPRDCQRPRRLLVHNLPHASDTTTAAEHYYGCHAPPIAAASVRPIASGHQRGSLAQRTRRFTVNYDLMTTANRMTTTNRSRGAPH